MSRGDYYHDAVNHRRSMRGGATQAERGLAAEMREMHPKRDNSTNSDHTMASNQFHHLLNQVVHDKNTAPFRVPGAMALIQDVFHNQRWRNFDRLDAPPDGQRRHQDAQVAEIPGYMDQISRAAYPGPESFTAPFDYGAEKTNLATVMKYGNTAFIPSQLHEKIKDYAHQNNIPVPSQYTTYKSQAKNEALVKYIEDQKADQIARETAPGAVQPPAAVIAQRRPLPSVPLPPMPLHLLDSLDYMPGSGNISMAQMAEQDKKVARQQAERQRIADEVEAAIAADDAREMANMANAPTA